MIYKCECCGEEITKEDYLKVDISKNALCNNCKKLSKKAREKRAIKLFYERKEMKDYIEKAINIIQEFCVKEYGERLEDEDLKDLKKIPLMYTTYEDDNELKELNIDNLEVNVFVNLIDFKMWVEYNNIEVYSETFGSKKDMIEHLEALDFDSWTNLDELDIYLNKIEEVDFII